MHRRGTHSPLESNPGRPRPRLLLLRPPSNQRSRLKKRNPKTQKPKTPANFLKSSYGPIGPRTPSARIQTFPSRRFGTIQKYTTAPPAATSSDGTTSRRQRCHLNHFLIVTSEPASVRK